MECNGTRQFDEAVAGEAAVSSCMRQLSTPVSGTPCPSHPCFTCLVQLNLCASIRLSLHPQLHVCLCVVRECMSPGVGPAIGFCSVAEAAACITTFAPL
jgi:hypothetical protein